MSLFRYVAEIAGLVNEFKSRTLLDYGCGNGSQYSRERCHVVWGVEVPAMHDPRKEFFRPKPIGQFDGVICIDYLDSVAGEDWPQALREIAAYARQWAFIAVDCNDNRPLASWDVIIRPYFPSAVRLVLRDARTVSAEQAELYERTFGRVSG